MKKALARIMVCCVLQVLLISLPVWAVPELINYEGKLMDIEGISLNGTYDITFNIYSAEIGGDALWKESQSITAIDGIFHVLLGSVAPFSPGLFENDELYLEVVVSGKALSPRQRFTSSAFALKSKDADTVDGKHANELGGGGAGDGNSLDAEDGDPADALYVDANGNVGIGTTRPTKKLHLHESTASTSLYAKFTNDATGSTGDDGIDFGVDKSGNAVFYNKENTNMILGTNNQTQVTILNSGKVGIGTTDPGAKLDVNGAIASRQITIYASTDTLDVADVNSVQVDTFDNDIVIGGLVNGVVGQIVYIFKGSSANNMIIDHWKETAGQKIVCPAQADLTFNGYGGVTLVCNGLNWFVID